MNSNNKKDHNFPSKGRKKTTSKKPISSRAVSLSSERSETSETLKKPEELEDISITEKAFIDKVIGESILRFQLLHQKDRANQVKEIQHLGNIITEYVEPFALIGYTLKGEEVVIMHTPSSRDEAAIVELLRVTFFNALNKRM